MRAKAGISCCKERWVIRTFGLLPFQMMSSRRKRDEREMRFDRKRIQAREMGLNFTSGNVATEAM